MTKVYEGVIFPPTRDEVVRHIMNPEDIGKVFVFHSNGVQDAG